MVKFYRMYPVFSFVGAELCHKILSFVGACQRCCDLGWVAGGHRVIFAQMRFWLCNGGKFYVFQDFYLS